MSIGLAEPTAPTAAPKSRKRVVSAKTDVRKPARRDGRVKATLVMDEQLDFRLTAVAASMKLDRSALAAQLIDAGLRRYGLDAALRAFSGESAGQVTHVESAEMVA